MRLSVFLIFLISVSCKSIENELPILSYTINDSGTKDYYSVSYKEDVFTNELGQSFTTRDLEGKVVIANFFFTRCPSICPPMRKTLIDVAQEFSEAENLMLISHTIDFKNDSVEILKEYAKATGIPHKKWQFLRAPKVQTEAQAKQLMTNIRANDDETDFYHSSYLTLIDNKQQIRGFYNALTNADIVRLKNDINLLLN
ncbi:SCO family protein [Winogradskyella sp. DF17]|uniref:SCO family protein n=1 Tax=Winogradskyella pelagia TaxID=2819984 RepID=A0ABS3T510_9FLAO|nr:SCO family protein [Winogradskyella sp. DF17]MBO3117838.1 SCO family protein [Winogradskyella sp. DF17]